METTPYEHVQFTIRHATTGQWEVHQSGLIAAIAAFRQKTDALEYAERIAATKPSADVVTGDG